MLVDFTVAHQQRVRGSPVDDTGRVGAGRRPLQGEFTWFISGKYAQGVLAWEIYQAGGAGYADFRGPDRANQAKVCALSLGR